MLITTGREKVRMELFGVRMLQQFVPYREEVELLKCHKTWVEAYKDSGEVLPSNGGGLVSQEEVGGCPGAHEASG